MLVMTSGSSGSGLVPRVLRRLKRDTKRLKRLFLGTTPTLHINEAKGLLRSIVQHLVCF